MNMSQTKYNKNKGDNMPTLKAQRSKYDRIISGKTEKFIPKKVKNLQVVVETLTPYQCKHILKYYNPKNRKLSIPQASKYAKDMNNGDWLTTGQSITFSTDGLLIDGQHRLFACVETDTPITVVVAYGVEPESFSVTDNGKIRSNSDVLEMIGYQNAGDLSALVRSIIAYEAGGSPDVRKGRRFDGANSITKSEIIKYIKDNPTVMDYLERYKKNQIVSASVSSFCYWLFSETHSKAEAEEYLDKVLLGYSLQPNTIESYLFNKLQRNKTAHQNKMTKIAIIANIILGWKRFKNYSKSSVMHLCWDAKQGLPSPCKK